MVITPDKCFNLKPDETYPNIVHGMGEKLKQITEIKGMSIEGQARRTVTSKIFNRIHSFIKLSENDYMVNTDDIITYLESVSFVNMTALPIIYMAVTGLELPRIVIESHLMKKFVSEGFRALEPDEKAFFRDNYNASGFFLKKPSFSGSSVVHIDDMRMKHRLENFETDFDDLIDYIDNKGDIVDIGDGYFMSYKSFNAEKYVKDQIGVVVPPLVADERAIILEKRFSDEQSDAVKGVLTAEERIVCLTGPAGSGKTFVTASIVDNAKAHGKDIVCCAFTGKAASRMEQSELDVSKLLFPPKTIHSLMGTLKIQENITNIDLVIIDEASTKNSELFAEFLSVLERHSTLDKIKFVFVGDKNQLPPIGGGQIFEDILNLKIYPVYSLTKIFRTTDPAMLELYNDVLKTKHKLPIKKHKKFFKGYDADNVGEFIRKIVGMLFAKDRNWHKDNKCIILSHTNKYVDYINYLCYKEVTGKTIDFYEYTFEDHPDDMELDWKPLPVFWKGAKIIFTRNDKIDVEANGEMIRVNNGTTGEVLGFIEDLVQVKSYDDGRIFLIEGDYPDVKLAYAMTVFKSQGSEAQFVIYFHSNHIFETKRLAYTAMTRAKTNVKIYTPFDGFRMAKDVPRYTNINSQ